MEVMRNQEFLLLPPEDVGELLSSDDLNVPTEETIYHALVLWIKHENNNRKKYLAKLLSHIKLPLMAPQVGTKVLNTLCPRYIRLRNNVTNSLQISFTFGKYL